MERETLFKGTRFSVEKNGKWQFMVHPGGATILPILHPNAENEQVILVRQWRHPIDGKLIETPAGTMDVEGETPQECAARELIEETGWKAGQIESVGYMHTSPGVSNEKLHLFIGTGLEFVGKPKIEGENTEVLIVSTKNAFSEIGKSIVDGKTIALLGYWMARPRGIDQDKLYENLKAAAVKEGVSVRRVGVGWLWPPRHPSLGDDPEEYNRDNQPPHPSLGD